jgi:hypothetical protein
VIFLSASRFSASARITCQFCCNGASSAKSVTGMKGVLGTFAKMGMNTLMGAMNVEWSNSWRLSGRRTLPRK